MTKRMITVLAVFLLLSVAAFAQNFTYQGAWPDTNYKGGTHGIVVDPDGYVWTSSYYASPWIIGTDTVSKSTRPIFIFSPDGSSVDTMYTVTTGGVIDTLYGNTRGMGQDQLGNILLCTAGPTRLYKIDYKTHAGIATHAVTEQGSSPTAPGCANDGTIFVGPVVGGSGTAICMYDQDLNYLGNAVDAPVGIARTMTVSKDGGTIYYASFTGPQMMWIYTGDALNGYSLTDSALAGMSDETLAWDPVTGNLWVSNDSRGTGPYTHLMWYAMDPSTKALVDSIKLPLATESNVDQYPRGAAFSPDGKIFYVGLFGTKFDRLYKFDRITGIEQELGAVVKDYSLNQNYPNPFNPNTTISFDVVKPGYVTLTVYNIQGKVVSKLVDQSMSSGSYKIIFDASNLASGTYIYQLNVNGVSISKKMTLLK